MYDIESPDCVCAVRVDGLSAEVPQATVQVRFREGRPEIDNPVIIGYLLATIVGQCAKEASSAPEIREAFEHAMGKDSIKYLGRK